MSPESARQDRTLTRAQRHPARCAAPRLPAIRRRLSDKVLVAFHDACQRGDLGVAQQLAQILETAINRGSTISNNDRRRDQEVVVAAYEWLWALRRMRQNDLAETPESPGDHASGVAT